MKNTQRKYLIIGILGSLILATILIIFYVNPSQNKDTKTLNKAALIKQAIYNYAKQDLKEPKEKRVKRLREYFSSDSPVFDYDLAEIKKLGAEKSSVSIKNIMECEEQEGGDLCVIAETEFFYYVKGKKKSKTINFWLTVKKENSGFKAYDIGIWDLELPEQKVFIY